MAVPKTHRFNHFFAYPTTETGRWAGVMGISAKCGRWFLTGDVFSIASDETLVTCKDCLNDRTWDSEDSEQ